MSAIGTYNLTLPDLPGVVAANNFLAITNPTGSGVNMLFLSFYASSYAAATSQTTNSMVLYKATGVSGGTDSSSSITRYSSTYPTSKALAATNNPSATLGKAFQTVTPTINAGTGGSTAPSVNIIPLDLDNTFVLRPGESIVWRTGAGNTNQLWNISTSWEEYF